MGKKELNVGLVLGVAVIVLGGLLLVARDQQVPAESVLTEPARPVVGTDAVSVSPGSGQVPAPSIGLAEDAHGYGNMLRYGSQDAIRARVVNDAAFRRYLFDNVVQEKELDRRGMLLAVLAAARHDEIRNQALAWVNAGSPELRRQAFVLLQSYDPTAPEVQQAVMQAMRQESSPEVLREAIRTLPVDVAMAGDAEGVAARLKILLTNTDDAVRSESLVQLVRWEADAGVLQSAVLAGLKDVSAQVRQASLAVLESTGIRAEPVKQALLVIAENAQEDFGARMEALARLNAYRLSDDERRRFKVARDVVSKQYSDGESPR